MNHIAFRVGTVAGVDEHDLGEVRPHDTIHLRMRMHMDIDIRRHVGQFDGARLAYAVTLVVTHLERELVNSIGHRAD